MVALEEVFSAASKAMVTVKGAMEPAAAGSAEAMRHKENLLLLSRGVAGAQQFSGELAQLSDDLLQQEGANMKQFDAFFSGKEELGKFSKLLAAAGEPGGAEKLVDKWSGLQQAVTAFDRLQNGSPFQILGASLRAMQPLVAAAMPGVKAPALLIGMWTAMVGSVESQAKGGQGAALQAITNALAGGLGDLALPKGANPGQQLFLQQLTHLSASLSVAAGVLMAQAPLPPGISPEDAEQYRPFTCTLAMGLISSSRAMECFFGQAMAAIGAEEQARLMAARAAAQAAKFSLGVGMGRKKGGQGLLSSFASQMEAMEAAVAMLQERGGLTDSQAAAFSQALSEAKFALEEGDPEPFMQAWSDLVDCLGGDYSKLEKDCQVVGKKASNCNALILAGQKERQGFQTSLVQPA